ncbi:MAG: hypothetical protein ABW168_07965 [Sedimenticola sp.]
MKQSRQVLVEKFPVAAIGNEADNEELTSDESDDEETRQLKEEIERLVKEKRTLRRRREKERLKATLEKSKREVAHLQKEGISDIAVDKLSVTKLDKPHVLAKIKHEKVVDDMADKVTLCDLRKNKHLRKSVATHMKNYGLVDSDTSDSYDSSSDDSCSSSSEYVKKAKGKKHKKKKRKSKKSGISSKSSDKVRLPQKWPHSQLQFEFVNKNIEFENLDLRLFVAGELEIISNESIGKVERRGRLELLKKILYYAGTYTFDGLKSFYAAWVRQIELGLKLWSDDPGQLEQAILSKHILRGESFRKSNILSKGKVNVPVDNRKDDENVERLWYCSWYNRNKCAKPNDHLEVIRGRMRNCLHICAECWQKDHKKLKHQECSRECPHSVV